MTLVMHCSERFWPAARSSSSSGGARATTDNQTSALAGVRSHLLIGFVTNFFDTLGIGSFAPDDGSVSPVAHRCPTS